MIAQGLAYYRHTDLGMDLGTGLRLLLDYAVCFYFLSFFSETIQGHLTAVSEEPSPSYSEVCT